MEKDDFIIEISLDESGLPLPTHQIAHERKAAIYDILKNNKFAVKKSRVKALPRGPFRLTLSIRNLHLVFKIRGAHSKTEYEFLLSLSPLRQVIKDYFEICKSYFDAVKRLPPSQIEAIDMGRRGVHLEGSRILMERLEGKIELDPQTSKRLFTLICALYSNM
jgi:uncharacterized protein (UPF0262 family)